MWTIKPGRIVTAEGPQRAEEDEYGIQRGVSHLSSSDK